MAVYRHAAVAGAFGLPNFELPHVWRGTNAHRFRGGERDYDGSMKVDMGAKSRAGELECRAAAICVARIDPNSHE
jgi:hypothetical protein